jgi:hypothetical protein
MIKRVDKILMQAVAICYKPFLKPEEAMIYCNLGRTQLAKKCAEYGIYKNSAGYFKREELDRMLSDALSIIDEKANQMKLNFRR